LELEYEEVFVISEPRKNPYVPIAKCDMACRFRKVTIMGQILIFHPAQKNNQGSTCDGSR
jgi:hypothetical protein